MNAACVRCNRPAFTILEFAAAIGASRLKINGDAARAFPGEYPRHARLTLNKTIYHVQRIVHLLYGFGPVLCLASVNLKQNRQFRV